MTVILTYLLMMAYIQSKNPVSHNAIGTVFYKTVCIKVKFTFLS